MLWRRIPPSTNESLVAAGTQREEAAAGLRDPCAEGLLDFDRQNMFK